MENHLPAVTVRRRLSLAVLAGGLGLDLSGLGVLNAALPSIGREFGLSDSTLQWTMTSYAVAFAGFLLFGGRAADVRGRRLVFGLGVGLFTAAALAGAVAPNIAVLIAARALQGAGAALSGPAALALLAEIFPEGPPRHRAMSVYAAVGAASFSAGVVLGGVLTGAFGWRSVMLFSAVVGVAVSAAVRTALPTGIRQPRSLDLVTASTATIVLALTVLGVSRARWDPLTVAALAGALIFLGLFVLRERRARDRLLPPSILTSTPVLVSSLAAVLNYTAGVGLLFFAPLYMQGVLGYPASLSGLAVVPSSLVLFVTANLVTGRVLSAFGPRLPMVAGLTLIAAAMLAWTFTPVDGTYWPHLLPGLVLTGIGQGLVYPAMTVGSLTGVPPRQHGVAGAVNVTAQQIGSSVGVAVLVMVAVRFGASGAEGTVAGYHAAYLTAAVACLAGGLIAALVHRGWKE